MWCTENLCSFSHTYILSFSQLNIWFNSILNNHQLDSYEFFCIKHSLTTFLKYNFQFVYRSRIINCLVLPVALDHFNIVALGCTLNSPKDNCSPLYIGTFHKSIWSSSGDYFVKRRHKTVLSHTPGFNIYRSTNSRTRYLSVQDFFPIFVLKITIFCRIFEKNR